MVHYKVVSEHNESMGPPTVAQRVELLKEKFTCLEETIKEEVSRTVEKAMDAMRHSNRGFNGGARYGNEEDGS